MPNSPSCSSPPSVQLDELQPPSPTPSGQNHLLLRRDGNDLGLDFCWQNLKRSFLRGGFFVLHQHSAAADKESSERPNIRSSNKSVFSSCAKGCCLLFKSLEHKCLISYCWCSLMMVIRLINNETGVISFTVRPSHSMLAVYVFVKRRFVHGRHPSQTCCVTSTLSSCQQTFTFRAQGEDDVVLC